ncbi:hypothetical protein HAHE_09200 [Haloferula helveola]|uniref:DUF3592 domain-containing protein n=1 Tax=Haloferula helveola TaxID=490095 RepID=A0ABN6H225_9BACT|nr:hypothetical protein HAHE_09200 [Haloferula helveola]
MSWRGWLGRILLAGVFFVALSIPLSIFWDATFPGKVYDCRDDNFFGYITPGSWVHGEIAYVDEIVPEASMSEPDVILNGWSTGRLFAVWGWMVGGSAAVAVALSFRMLRGWDPGPELD